MLAKSSSRDSTNVMSYLKRNMIPIRAHAIVKCRQLPTELFTY